MWRFHLTHSLSQGISLKICVALSRPWRLRTTCTRTALRRRPRLRRAAFDFHAHKTAEKEKLLRTAAHGEQGNRRAACLELSSGARTAERKRVHASVCPWATLCQTYGPRALVSERS